MSGAYVRGLLLIILVLSSIAGVLGFAYKDVVHAFKSNRELNILILTFFSLGVINSFLKIISIKNDIKWFSSYSKGLELDPTLTQKAKYISTIAQLFQNNRGRVSINAVAWRNLIDGVSDRLSHSRAFGKFLTGILVFFGLLGTFWGLTKTIGSIADVIGGLSAGQAGQDATELFSQLKDSIQEPLSGMGMAFSASMFGLACSLIIGFLDLQVGNIYNRFVSELEDWLAQYTSFSGETLGAVSQINSMGPMPVEYNDALVTKIGHTMEKMALVVANSENFRQEFMLHINSFSEKMVRFADQSKTSQSLMEKIAEHHIDTQSLLKKLNQSMATSNFDETTKNSLKVIPSLLERLTAQVQAGNDKVANELKDEIRLLTQLIAKMQSVPMGNTPKPQGTANPQPQQSPAAGPAIPPSLRR